MPYEEHPSCRPPENPDAPIWRYMDFAKLVDLMERHSLFFCRVDRLGDPFEGSMPRRNVEGRAAHFAAQGLPLHVAEDMPRLHRLTREETAVHCWHVNPHESAAMWKLYLQGSDGVVIRSTFGRLAESLADAPERVFVGLVDYLDYEFDGIRDPPLIAPVLTKRISFEHERELRAMVWFPAQMHVPPEERTWDAGLYVRVDISRLIEAVYVAPTAADWFADLVDRVVRHYLPDVPIQHSDLGRDPVF